jgi:hypothetical protein
VRESRVESARVESRECESRESRVRESRVRESRVESEQGDMLLGISVVKVRMAEVDHWQGHGQPRIDERARRRLLEDLVSETVRTCRHEIYHQTSDNNNKDDGEQDPNTSRVGPRSYSPRETVVQRVGPRSYSPFPRETVVPRHSVDTHEGQVEGKDAGHNHSYSKTVRNNEGMHTGAHQRLAASKQQGKNREKFSENDFVVLPVEGLSGTNVIRRLNHGDELHVLLR